MHEVLIKSDLVGEALLAPGAYPDFIEVYVVPDRDRFLASFGGPDDDEVQAFCEFLHEDRGDRKRSGSVVFDHRFVTVENIAHECCHAALEFSHEVMHSEGVKAMQPEEQDEYYMEMVPRVTGWLSHQCFDLLRAHLTNAAMGRAEAVASFTPPVIKQTSPRCSHCGGLGIIMSAPIDYQGTGHAYSKPVSCGKCNGTRILGPQVQSDVTSQAQTRSENPLSTPTPK